MTEEEMAVAEVPWIESIEELTSYITKLVEQDHEYGTAVYAISMAATATFHYVAAKLGATGFQASCADMDILRRTRSYKGPFMVIDGSKLLYPQYDIIADVQGAIEGWQSWAAEEAQKKLDEGGIVAPAVKTHWEKLVKQNDDR